jgi:hypothetical protein
MTYPKASWPVGDIAFGYQTEDGVEAYPVEEIHITFPPTSDEPKTYDMSDLVSLSHGITIELTPRQSWDLQCMLWGWKTDFIYRDGWNKRITGDAP